MSTPRNLNWLRGLKVDGIPDFGSRMHEMITDMVNATQSVATQTNASVGGAAGPPPSLQGIVATSTETGVHVSFQHEGDFARGVTYHGDYADNPHFTNPFPFGGTPSREIDLPTGSKQIYVRGFAAYPTSAPTAPVYHGGTTPKPVTGGTPSPLGMSQGSGTGRPGEGLQAYGQNAFRSSTGKAPATVNPKAPSPPSVSRIGGGDD